MNSSMQQQNPRRNNRRMSCWFLLSTVLLLQSTKLFQSSVQAVRYPWTPTTGIHHPTIIENHDHVDTSTNNNYSRSLLRVLTLRAGDVSDESTANASKRRRKRKRVRQDQPPSSSTDVEKGEELVIDDVASQQQQQQSDAEPVIKKGKRKRRRLFSSKKKEDVDPSIDEGTDNQEDVITTSSNNETGKRIKKRRRKKAVAETNEADLDQEVELEESMPACNEDVVVAEDGIPEMGKVSGDTDASPEDGNEVDNTEATQATVRTKKRKRKKRGTSKKVEDTIDDVVIDEETPEAIVATPLPSMDASVEILSEEVNRAKKRKRKKRVTIIPVQDAVDVDKREETSEAIDESQVSIEIPSEEMNRTIKKRKRKRRGTNKTAQDTSDDAANEGETPPEVIDTSPLPSINASVEIPSEEIVPESIGSSIEVDESLKLPPMEDEEVEEVQAKYAVGSVETEVEPASDDEKSITIIDAPVEKESDGEYTVESTDEVPVEAEKGVEELSLEATDDGAERETESASDDEKSITITDDSTNKESDGEYTVEVADEVPAEAENEEVEELPTEESVDGAERETESASDDEKSVAVSDAPTDKESESDGEYTEEAADEVPAEAESEEVGELSLEATDDGADAEYNDEIEHVVIDASIEIPEEEIVPESVDASIGVEEDFRAEELEEVDGCLDDMSVLVNNEEDEEEEEEGLQESNVDLSSDEKESGIPTLPAEEGVASVEYNPISVEEADAKDSDDEGIKDDDGNSDKNEEEEDSEPSTFSEMSETSLQSSDHPIEPENHENETEEVASQEETQEEENAVVEVSPAQLEQSNDVDEITEDETNIDQKPIELEKMEDDCLTISIVTWNLAEASFSEKEASFFKKFRKGESKIGSDLVLIGAQECEDIKPRRAEGHRSRHLRRVGIQMLGKDYVPLAIHSLGGIQMALYCHRDVLGDVEMVNIADVTCGVGNVFHNKGAIGVYLKMKRQNNGVAKSSRMLFATGHLAAHVKNVDARNDDFKRIISGLEAQAPARFLRPKKNPDGSPSECDGSYLLKSMDHVFFAGDLNYRVDLPREYVERCIIDIKDNRSCERLEEADDLMNKLLRRDQLLQTIASGRAFPQFSEGKITFLPTFKFDKGTQNYDTSHKQRVPAWTDRILFRSSKVNVLEYQSVPAATHSDHRPVFGTYQLGWGVTTKDSSRSRGGKRGRRNRKK